MLFYQFHYLCDTDFINYIITHDSAFVY